jgi:membrane protease YdiL (CAAX protease family)
LSGAGGVPSPRLRRRRARETVLATMAAGRDVETLGAQAERLGARGERTGMLARTRPVLFVIAGYAAVGALAAGTSVLLGHDPIACDGWLGARGTASFLLSLGLGLPLGAATIVSTRVLVRRSPWAHALHAALRPAVHNADDLTLFAVAAASSAGEELLFRGLLVPIVGVVASSILFGSLHQIRGTARWAWMAWATIMGLFFAAVFASTGSLVGPLVAHAAINHSNLRFLRDNDPLPRKRSLGGLLRRP